MQQQILIFGEEFTDIPKDLYIPPEPLTVLLETFEGPLDLLLYLIRKENMNILDIEIFSITKQYMEYIEIMKDSDISLAAEYLLMAATLAEIKARYLLPKKKKDEQQNEDSEEDPRAELARRLLKYEQTKITATRLKKLPYVGSGIALSAHSEPQGLIPIKKPKTEINKLAAAIEKLYYRKQLSRNYELEQEHLSLSERISVIEKSLQNNGKNWSDLSKYAKSSEGKAGLVVSLMALLELDKAQVIEWKQEEHFAKIFLRERQ